VDKDFDRFLKPWGFYIPYPIHTEEHHGQGRKDKEVPNFPWVEEPWTKHSNPLIGPHGKIPLSGFPRPKKSSADAIFGGDAGASSSVANAGWF